MTSRDQAGPDPLGHELYRSLFESAPDAVLVIDSSGTIVAANPQAERLFGYPARELEGQAIEKLIPERFRSAHTRYRDGYVGNPAPRPMGSGLDLWARHESGTEFPVEISLSPLRYQGQTLVSAAVRNVTDRKQVQDALRTARDELEDRVRDRTAKLAEQISARERDIDQMQRQAEMLDLASEPIFAWDMERGIIFWNKAAAETYGYAREEAISRSSHELLSTTHPKGIAHIREALVREGRWDGELLHTTRDGRRIVMESRMALVTTRSGDRLVLESCRDITARRAAEEGFRQAQKMEAVGQLTGGIAHDFNNLLTIILANLQLLEDELAPGSPPLELAASATRAAQRGADLTRKLLIFARRQRLESAPLDVNELVSNMTGMLARTLGEHIRIVESLMPDVPKVLTDAGQLETALLNLAINARDAMPKGGRLSIETGETVVEANDERRDAGLAAGAYVSVAVSDTGTGMTSEVMARAFEPFFTTKEAGRGTGLGLSMVYGFVKQSGGHVSLYSEAGYGTTVTLYLPQATKAEAAATVQSAVHPTGTETILLVEDDDEVRQATRKLLAGLGYKVVEAADAATALSLLAQHDGVQLLLTDVVLAQGMSGPELAREARRSSPRLKILFMSGHVRDTVAFDEQLQQDAQFLAKPFRKAELAQKLRLALGSRKA
jgi:PAS domain S-box-containing protein